MRTRTRIRPSVRPSVRPSDVNTTGIVIFVSIRAISSKMHIICRMIAMWIFQRLSRIIYPYLIVLIIYGILP
jgi:hypothetical protein